MAIVCCCSCSIQQWTAHDCNGMQLRSCVVFQYISLINSCLQWQLFGLAIHSNKQHMTVLSCNTQQGSAHELQWQVCDLAMYSSEQRMVSPGTCAVMCNHSCGYDSNAMLAADSEHFASSLS